MPSAAPTSVELFYSYAHTDEPLRKELQKHLTALKRSGLIRDWYDRKIEHGSEWATEIREAMERAGVILLLISADFLASKYISDIELPFALERHAAGRATVIPVLLRPVEWRDSPFAKLQVLPSDALPVTSWLNRDEAFSDVAGRLREFLYGQRLSEAKPQNVLPGATGVTQQRVVDAAIASTVIVDEPADVVMMVRRTTSGGLRAILRHDRTYSPASDDVLSKTLELDFSSDAPGKVLPTALGLSLEAPGFDPPKQTKRIRIPPTGDTDVSVFMVTPKRPGVLRLNLQMMSDNVEIGSQMLVTKSLLAPIDDSIVSYHVTSLFEGTLTQPDTGGRSEFTRFFNTRPRAAEAGNQSQPSGMPQEVQPLGSPGNRPGNQPGEFTRMFGTPNRTGARDPSPSAPPIGPGLGSDGGSATGAFSSPQAPLPPPPKSSGPGEFTCMMGANAMPTLGQPPPTPSGQANVKSIGPLLVIIGALLLAIILITAFLTLRRG